MTIKIFLRHLLSISAIFFLGIGIVTVLLLSDRIFALQVTEKNKSTYGSESSNPISWFVQIGEAMTMPACYASPPPVYDYQYQYQYQYQYEYPTPYSGYQYQYEYPTPYSGYQYQYEYPTPYSGYQYQYEYPSPIVYSYQYQYEYPSPIVYSYQYEYPTPATTCPFATYSNCNLPVSPSPVGTTAGSCSSGYTGFCSYTCMSGGAWSRNSNSCSAQPACSDGNDNDTDGYTDFVGNDPGCSSAGDTSETDAVVNLTASPRLVEIGTNIGVLEWDTNGMNESLCTLTGGATGSTNLIISAGTIDEGVLSNITINAKTTYTLKCGGQSDTATFEVVPIGFET